MSFEATAVEKISKGAILALKPGANTVANSSGSGTTEKFGGIAAADKASSDTRTNLSCHMFGVWDCRVGGNISSGDLLKLSGANILTNGVNASHISGGQVVGKAEEDGANGSTIRVRLIGS